MKRIKLVIFFVLGLVLLTSCNGLSHEKFPSGPQIDENPSETVSSYLLTYYDGGTKVSQVKLEKGESFTLIEATKTPLGHNFKGWSQSKTEYVAVDFDTMPANDVDLYAYYEKITYTITFNANIILPDGTSTTKDYQYGDRLGNYVPSDLQEAFDQQTEYVFVGWYKDPEFKEAFTEVSMPASNITLYAKWQFSGIRFMNGTDVFYEVKEDVGTSVAVPLQTPTKDGYDFVGWVDENGVKVSFPLTVTDEVQHIYASFTPKSNISYKVEHYLENLNGTFVRTEVENLTASTDDEVNAIWKTYTGFTKDEDNENNVLKGIINYNGTLVLKVYYTRNSYQLSFDTDGGTVISTATYKYEQAMLAPSMPTKTGHTFVKWQINGNDYTFTTMPAENVELTAVWQINQYTITFDTDGGSSVTSITQDYGTAVTAPANPTKVGYTFAGWDKAVPETMPAENVTVKAKWTANQYTITFNVNGGTTVTSITAAYGSELTKPNDPTKVGYTFAGWDQEFPETMPLNGLTLSAKWKVNQYTITFDTDGGSSVTSITQDYGTAVTAPANPTKVGYTFAGWDKAVPETMPAENVTVKAKWTANQYTITFNVNGGTTVTSITAAYGSELTKPTDPTKVGYTFAGWDQEFPETMPLNGLTLTAKWTPVEYKVTFKADGVEVGTDTYTVEDKTVTEPSVPEKVGHTGKWETYTLTTGDVEVKAVYTVNQYTITFDTDGGSSVTSITQDYGTAVTAPANPTKVGYTFAGWDKAVPETMPAESVTVKAKWTVNQYTITYEADGGQLPTNTCTDIDAMIAEFWKDLYAWSGSTKEFETFKSEALTSWSKNSAYSEALVYKANGKDMKDDNYFVSASDNYDKWMPWMNAFDSQVTVVSANGTQTAWGSTWTGYLRLYELLSKTTRFKEAHQKIIYSALEISTEYTTKYTIENNDIILPVLIKKAYNFIGWYDNPEFTGSAITTISKGSNGNKTLYAKFEFAGYKINFELDGANINYETREDLVADFIKDAQTFLNITNNPKTMAAFATYFVGAEGMFTDPNYATKWVWLKEYIINSTSTEIVDGNGTPVVNYLKDNQQSYWKYNLGAFLFKENRTSWPKSADYTQDALANGFWDELEATFENKVYASISELPSIYKEGYDFVGWYDNPEFTGNPVITLSSDATLYAKFIKRYTINYELNGGVVNYETREDLVDDFLKDAMAWGNKTSKPDGMVQGAGDTKVGFANVFSSQIYGIFSDPTYGLKWTWLKEYIIETTTNATSKSNLQTGDEVFWRYSIGAFLFKEYRSSYPTTEDFTQDAAANGFWDELATAQKTAEGIDTTTLPTNVYKEHYTFAGWYIGETKVTTVTDTATVTAKWTPVEYKVTFKADGVEVGTDTYTVEDKTVTEPSVPEKVGHTGKWETYTLTTGDVEVKAVYTVNQYTITFDTDGGSSVTSITQDYGTAVTAPKNPVKEGYKFAGWDQELPSLIGAENITLIAKWEPLQTVEISFASKNNRLSQDTSSQVWYSGGITITNNKSASVTNVADYANPVRLYKTSDVIISYANPIYQIVINSTEAKYAFAETDTIEGATLIVNGTTAIIILDSPSETFTIKSLPRQIRISTLTIKVEEALKTTSLSFDANGGTGSIDDIIKLPNDNFVIPLITGITAPENKQFKCWNTKSDGTGTSYNFGDSVVLNSNTTLYAIWKDADPVEMTIAEAIATADETLVILKGTVHSIDTAWSDTYNNITITLKDSTGTLSIYRLATKVELGDIVTITGKMTTYSGNRQVAAGATAEITGHDDSYDNIVSIEVTITEANEIASTKEHSTYTIEKYIVTGTIKEIVNSTYGNMYIEDADGNTLYIYGVYINGTKYGEVTDAKPVVGDKVTLEGVLGTYNDSNQMKNADLVSYEAAGGEEPTPVTTTVVIADYATTNGWTNATMYNTVDVDGKITVTAQAVNKSGNTGKYYTNGNNWRIYQSDNEATLTFSAAEGCTIVSIKITYTNNNGGVLVWNSNNFTSNVLVKVNGSSIVFTVSSTTGSTSGQVRVTAIEVTYLA